MDPDLEQGGKINVMRRMQHQREYNWFSTRRLRIDAANIGPNRFHQNRTVS